LEPFFGDFDLDPFFGDLDLEPFFGDFDFLDFLGDLDFDSFLGDLDLPVFFFGSCYAFFAILVGDFDLDPALDFLSFIVTRFSGDLDLDLPPFLAGDLDLDLPPFLAGFLPPLGGDLDVRDFFGDLPFLAGDFDLEPLFLAGDFDLEPLFLAGDLDLDPVFFGDFPFPGDTLFLTFLGVLDSFFGGPFGTISPAFAAEFSAYEPSSLSPRSWILMAVATLNMTAMV
jgi:hypothetical protein